MKSRPTCEASTVLDSSPTQNSVEFLWFHLRQGKMRVIMVWMRLFDEWAQVLTISDEVTFQAMMMADLGEN